MQGMRAQTSKCTYVRAYVGTYVRTYLRTYVRTFSHVPTYVRTYARTSGSPGLVLAARSSATATAAGRGSHQARRARRGRRLGPSRTATRSNSSRGSFGHRRRVQLPASSALMLGSPGSSALMLGSSVQVRSCGQHAYARIYVCTYVRTYVVGHVVPGVRTYQYSHVAYVRTYVRTYLIRKTRARC